MDSVKAQQLSSEFESALSKVLPDLAQLLQKNQVSKTLEIDLGSDFLNVANTATCTCCYIKGVLKCGSMYSPPAPMSAGEDTLGMTPDQSLMFCKDVELKLSTVLPALSQFVKPVNEFFEIHFLIDPATVNPGQSVVCQWGSDSILQCSNS